MSEVAAIGTPAQITMLALGGARIYPAGSADDARAAWRRLRPDVSVVVLTEAAAEALGDERIAAGSPLSVVMAPWPA